MRSQPIVSASDRGPLDNADSVIVSVAGKSAITDFDAACYTVFTLGKWSGDGDFIFTIAGNRKSHLVRLPIKARLMR